MKKSYKYWLSPDKTLLFCQVYIDNKPAIRFWRDLIGFQVSSVVGKPFDITSFDLELHSFLRLTHQYIVNKDSLDVKVEDMFELDNLNV